MLYKYQVMFFTPFHAAEQRNQELKTTRRSIPQGERLSETSALGEQRREAEGQVNGCLFWFVFGQAKMKIQ